MGLMTILLATCLQAQVSKSDASKDPYIVVLGTLQDGGSPHLGCEKDCCKTIDPNKKVVSLGLIEHIGHYAGLMFLGREAMNSKDVPVYAMPKMKIFLENNGPWSQLVSLNNIRIHPLSEGKWEDLGPRLKVKPILVPHRDEFSETVGYIIEGPNKKLLFIPDIDKWEKWRTDIVSLIKEVDHALIDGTFFSAAEVGNRNITEIPHPLVEESMKLFDALSIKEKQKIMFIHFNHTNR